MAYLIDTQILIWSLLAPENLSVQNQTLLRNNLIYASQISLYEIAIKQKINKLSDFDLPIKALLNQLRTDGFQIIPLKNEHLVAYNSIPLFADHKDPFDRLILATALSERLPVISADRNFKYYIPQIHLIENG